MAKRILVLSQLYWPDEVAVAQMVTDLTKYLDNKGCEVTVYCSRHEYEHTDRAHSRLDKLQNINIHRIRHTSFGKGSKLGRIIDILTFNLVIFFKLLTLKRHHFDLMIGLTNPPLLSYIGLHIAKWKKLRFYYWAMDLQPEISFRLGYLNKDSLAAKLLSKMSKYIYKQSDGIIALDVYMKAFIGAHADKDKIQVIPVWPATVKQGEGNGPNAFRVKHGLENDIVIMYSGNHSIAHPMDTIMEVARLLKEDSRFRFVFIGEGIRKNDVREFQKKYELDNMLLLPYQPREQIHISLSAADFQVVILGDNLVGLTHPCKIYTAMGLGIPILFIGPSPSHVSDLAQGHDGNVLAEHGEEELIVRALQSFADQKVTDDSIATYNKQLIAQAYTPEHSMQAIYNFLQTG